MTGKAPGAVGVTFAKGVLDDVAELTTPAADNDQAGKGVAEALKRRIAESVSTSRPTKRSHASA
jgi:hypothetical protein